MILNNQYDPLVIPTVQEWPKNKESNMNHISQKGALPSKGNSSGIEHGGSVA